MLKDHQLNLLKDILSQPAAPFFETHVANCVSHYLNKANVPYFFDPVGNIIIGVGNKKAYVNLVKKNAKEPVRIFIAHMDHPGFQGAKWISKNQLLVKWRGGSPVKHLSGAKVWLASEEKQLAHGRLSNITLHQSRLSIDTAIVRFKHLSEDISQLKATSLFGGFAFRSHVWTSGKRLYTRAADDLVGVFCIVMTAIAAFQKQKNQVPFIGLLTRAEEVGFVGAVRHLEQGWLNKSGRPLVCISLEASRHLPGAVIGKGPVVRQGDRRTTFESNALQVLSELANKTLPGHHQRRVMDGGSCEATATTAWGLPTVGITLPLGNYHNQGMDGGMDCPRLNGPAPEFVHLDDIEGELKLCQALMSADLNWHDPWSSLRHRLIKISNKYNKLI